MVWCVYVVLAKLKRGARSKISKTLCTWLVGICAIGLSYAHTGYFSQTLYLFNVYWRKYYWCCSWWNGMKEEILIFKMKSFDFLTSFIRFWDNLLALRLANLKLIFSEKNFLSCVNRLIANPTNWSETLKYLVDTYLERNSQPE